MRSIFNRFKKKADYTRVLACQMTRQALHTLVVNHGDTLSPLIESYEAVPLESVALQQDLRRFIKQHRLSKLPTTTVLGQDDYSLSIVDKPAVPHEEQLAALRWQIKDMVDYDLNDAALDVFGTPGRDGTVDSKFINVIVAQRSKITEPLARLKDAGLNVSIVDIPELAQRNVAAYLPEDKNGVVLVYLSQGAGLITVTRQNILYLSRHLDFGTGMFLHEADAGALTDNMKGWLDNVVIEIQRSLDYYESHFDLPPISSVVIAPLAQAIYGLTEYLSSQLGLSTRLLDINEDFQVASEMNLEQQVSCFPCLGGALRREPPDR